MGAGAIRVVPHDVPLWVDAIGIRRARHAHGIIDGDELAPPGLNHHGSTSARRGQGRARLRRRGQAQSTHEEQRDQDQDRQRGGHDQRDPGEAAGRTRAARDGTGRTGVQRDHTGCSRGGLLLEGACDGAIAVRGEAGVVATSIIRR
jgi:hypothetical protein